MSAVAFSATWGVVRFAFVIHHPFSLACEDTSFVAAMTLTCSAFIPTRGLPNSAAPSIPEKPGTALAALPSQLSTRVCQPLLGFAIATGTGFDWSDLTGRTLLWGFRRIRAARASGETKLAHYSRVTGRSWMPNSAATCQMARAASLRSWIVPAQVGIRKLCLAEGTLCWGQAQKLPTER